MISWKILRWNELSTQQLYSLLELRLSVFIIEQNCPYPELDYKDQLAIHLMGINDKDECVAYARIFEAGIYFDEESIGRVCTRGNSRKLGLGRELMKRTLVYMDKELPGQFIVISAQSYLIRFYQDFGFVCEGEEYLEDGIPHTRMRRKKW